MVVDCTIRLTDTVTKPDSSYAAKVVVCGSHSGIYSYYLAARAQIRAVILNDAGVGKDEACIAGLAYFDDIGMAAATVGNWTAHIGDACDMWARGVISHVNKAAALLTPTTPVPAIPLGEVDQRSLLMSRYTRAVNYLGLCALVVPCGFTQAGLPISLQIICRKYDEKGALRIGWAFENETGWNDSTPNMTKSE